MIACRLCCRSVVLTLHSFQMQSLPPRARRGQDTLLRLCGVLLECDTVCALDIMPTWVDDDDDDGEAERAESARTATIFDHVCNMIAIPILNVAAEDAAQQQQRGGQGAAAEDPMVLLASAYVDKLKTAKEVRERQRTTDSVASRGGRGRESGGRRHVNGGGELTQEDLERLTGLLPIPIFLFSPSARVQEFVSLSPQAIFATCNCSQALKN